MFFIFSANAGYVVKGKNIFSKSDKLKNFTLTIDPNGAPLSAGSMFTNFGDSNGLNTIVIIDTSSNISIPAVIFPFTFGEHFDIEV